MTSAHVRDLGRLADILLESDQPDELRSGCSELYELLAEGSSFDPRETTADADVNLPSGVALSPRLAAQCILDVARTIAFLRGTARAITEAQKRREGKIEVVYAGTGPFAPLVIPLMTRLAPERIAFTLIDIHHESVASVESLIGAFGFRHLVRAVVRADACEYRHPAPVDVLITETMQRALAKEPFVAIVGNFRSQLAPRGILVPERVSVSFALLDGERESRRWNGESIAPDSVHCATVADVTATTDRVERQRLILTGAVEKRWPALMTRIDVFGGCTLGEYESGLTMPEILWPLCPLVEDETLELWYELGAIPGVRCERKT